MPPRLRQLALTAHVSLSVGWLGAVLAYLALAIAGLVGAEPPRVRAAYVAMELIGWSVIVPLSLGALLTGLVQSLGTEWGLFRHYWVAAKFVLTVLATTILLLHMKNVSWMARLAESTPLGAGDHLQFRKHLLVHAAGGLVVLLTATVLSLHKPWGRTRYAQRMLEEQRRGEPGATRAGSRSSVLLLGLALLLLVVVLLHLGGGGPALH